MTKLAKFGITATAATLAIGAGVLLSSSRPVEAASNVPPAKLVEPSQASREVALLAGGCFWGVEGVYEHVNGVIDVTSGFAGRSVRGVNYSTVSSGSTGSAEAVRIVFDPRRVSYADLLRILFSVVADPTQVNRQGPDVGSQYRTAIFPQSPAQARVARAYIAQLTQARVFPKPIATKVESGRFVEAETYHQDYMRRNPDPPYVVAHDRPKLAELKRRFPASWKG
jgi:peptide-methionine (S)-S-oxide reductase